MFAAPKVSGNAYGILPYRAAAICFFSLPQEAAERLAEYAGATIRIVKTEDKQATRSLIHRTYAVR